MADIRKLETRKPGTLSQDVYSGLRKRILGLEIRPGELLSIRDISAKWGAGRTPVRDALIRLEEEGLAVSLPQRGIRISRINPHRVAEERLIRATLEIPTDLAFLGTRRPGDIEALKEILAEQKTCVRRRDLRRLLESDDRFHRVFFQATDRMLCWQTIQNTCGHYHRVRLLTMLEKGVRDGVVRQHEEILQSILGNNGEKLRDILKVHLGKIDREEKELAARYPELFDQNPAAYKKSTSPLQSDFLETLEQKKGASLFYETE